MTRPAILNELEQQRMSEAFDASIAGSMEPASAPYQYITGIDASDADGAAVDTDLRQAMFSAGLSVETGNRLAQTINETACELLNASPEHIDSYMQTQERMLRSTWGSSYDARLATTREFIRQAGEHSPALRALVENHPELFASWQTVTAIERVAEHQQRRLRGK